MHADGERTIVVNAVHSEPFTLESGQPQGCCCSVVVYTIAEEPTAILVRMTKQQLDQLKKDFPNIAALQVLDPVDGLVLPSGASIVDVRYADDFNALVRRTGLGAFFAMLAFCGLGSGAQLNDLKTYVIWIGPGRDEAPWPEGLQRGVQWVYDSAELTAQSKELGLVVLGINLSNNPAARGLVWDRLLAKAIANLKTWAGVPLEEDERVDIFRAYAMALWTYTARVMSPEPRHVARMAALRRRFVLTGRLTDVTALTPPRQLSTFSHMKATDIADARADGGDGLPTIAEWLDTLRVQWVLRLLDPASHTQRWAELPLHWAQTALGAWVLPAGERGPPSSRIGVCSFLCRHQQTESALTRSPVVPYEWRLRFKAFHVAMQKVCIRSPATWEAAMAEPLWCNTLFDTGRGVYADCREPTGAARTKWLNWARTGVRHLGDVCHDAGGYKTLAQLKVAGLSPKATTAQYDALIGYVYSLTLWDVS